MHQKVEDPGEVKFMRLITGEDIITEMKSTSVDNNYILVNPLKIVYSVGDRPGIMSIGLIQWVFPEIAASHEIPIKVNDVLTMCDPSAEMEISYWESLKRLEKSISFDFSNKRQSSIKQEQDYDDMSEYEADLLDELIESMKKMDKGKLH